MAIADEAQAIVDHADEIIDETVDGVVDVVEIVKNNPYVLAAVGILGLAAGAAGGYFVAMKRLNAKYEEDLAFEIDKTKEFYANLNKVSSDGEPKTPLQVLEERHGAEAAADVVRRYQGRKAAEEALAEEVWGDEFGDEEDEAQIAKVEEHVAVRNVFKDETFDLEEEKKYRTEEKPYIITHDEYFENDPNYDQVALLYFQVDDTVAYEEDNMKTVEDTDSLIGDDHLVRFGSGSRDPNRVYVRNDKTETLYEIVRSKGSYLEEVLGMTDEPDSLKHSANRDRRREFRRGDE